MDLGIFIGGLTLLATCVFGALMYFKQFPKRSLTYAMTSSPLLNGRTEGLEVRLGGVELKAPYLVYLHVTSRSRADIPSSAFDAGQPLRFDFGREALGGSTPDGSMQHELNGSQVCFPPQLVRRRTAISIAFITEGPPSGIVVDSPLVDVAVTRSKQGVDATPTRAQLISVTASLAGLVGSFAFLIWTATNSLWSLVK